MGTFVSAMAGGGNWANWILQGIFLALFSNLFNLLDTRPARAAGAYFNISLTGMFLFRE